MEDRIAGHATQDQLLRTKWCGGYAIPHCMACHAPPSKMPRGVVMIERGGGLFPLLICDDCLDRARSMFPTAKMAAS